MKGNDSRQTAQNIPGVPSNGGLPQTGQRNGATAERHGMSTDSRRNGIARPQRFFE